MSVLICAAVTAILIAAIPFFHSCQELYNDVFRIHILANSDSAADQSLKLAVRDRVVRDCAAYYDGCRDKASAMRVTQEHLGDIARIAAQEIRSRGFN